MKRIVRCFLLSAGLLLCLALTMFAMADDTYGDFTYASSSNTTCTITGYTGSGAEVEVPGEIDGMTVTSLGRAAFQGNTTITRVTLSQGLLNIGADAFLNCTSLTEVTIPYGVNNIYSRAFSGCTSLAQIDLPDSVTVRITDIAIFQGCAQLRSVRLPAGSASIVRNMFENCAALQSIDLPSGVTSIGLGAFSGCTSLKSIDLPDGVTSIGFSAFSGCTSLKSIDIPDGVESIGSYAFQGCSSLCSAGVFGNNATLGDRAFYHCESLAEVVLAGITSIGEEAFFECTALKSISIPDSVTSIKGSTFKGCSALESIRIPGTVTAIAEYTFSGCSGLKTADIANGVGSIDRGAFENCTSLTGIRIPDSVTSIGPDAFSNCVSMTTASLGNKVSTIGYEAFMGCSALMRIDLPDAVATLGNRAFYNCSSLASIGFGSGLTSVGEYIFNGCTGLTSVEIPGDLTLIGAYMFANCTNLARVNISEGVTSIGKGAFVKAAFKEITIPASVVSIGEDALKTSNQVISVEFRGMETVIDQNGLPTLYKNNIYCFADSAAHTWAEGRNQDIILFDAFDCAEQSSVTLEDDFSLPVGASRQLSVGVFPRGESPEVAWTSSATDVVTVDGGYITAVASGDAAVTATAYGKTATVNIHAYIAPESFELSETSLTLEAGDTYQLEPVSIVPEGSDISLVWLSRKESLATVDQNGVITARNVGDATITATDAMGNLRACVVHIIYPPIVSVELSPASMEMITGQQNGISVELIADNITFEDQGVTWESSVPAVVTITTDRFGRVLVIAQGPGSAVITATAENGVSGTCEVLVTSANTLFLPADLKQIDEDAFSGTDAVTVVIPEGCTTIGKAFRNCGSLKYVIIPESVVSIEDGAFEGCRSDLYLIIPNDTRFVQYATNNSLHYRLAP